MKTIKKNELYVGLKSLLESRGVKISNPTYSQAVRRACSFLTDTVNLAHVGAVKARVKVDANLEKLRETIHAATAPKPPVLYPGKNSAKQQATPKGSRKAVVPKVAKVPSVKPKATKPKTARRKTASA